MSRKSNAVFLFLRENGPMAASRLSRYGAKFPCEHRCWIDAVGAGEVTLRYRRSMSARFFSGIRVVPRKFYAFRPYFTGTKGVFYYHCNGWYP